MHLGHSKLHQSYNGENRIASDRKQFSRSNEPGMEENKMRTYLAKSRSVNKVHEPSFEINKLIKMKMILFQQLRFLEFK